MKLPGFLPFSLLVAAAFVWSAHSVAQDSERRGLGLRPPTLAEMAEDARSQVRTKMVLPNKLAMERVRAERLLKGLPTPPLTPPVRFGEEVVSFAAASPVSAGSGVGSSPLIGSTPGRVDNSTLPNFPPIRNQGTIGSCASFSSAYTVGTHMFRHPDLAGKWMT